MTKWKTSDKFKGYETAYELLVKHKVLSGKEKIFVPLSGDCLFIPHAIWKGHTIVANELTEIAVKELRKHFPKAKFEESELKPKGTLHKSEKLNIHQCSIFDVDIPKESFDIIYDKDSLGALPPSTRENYLKTVLPLLKPGGYVHLEVKSKKVGDEEPDMATGPPFHFTKDLVAKLYSGFKLVEYTASIYNTGHPTWKQQCFMLQKPKAAA